MRSPSVVVTRPEPGLSKTCKEVEALGWQPIPSPALTVQHLRTLPPYQEPSSILLTSGQAVFALAPFNPNTPVYTVGDATAQKVRSLGFHYVESAKGDGRKLGALVQRKKSCLGRAILFPCGYGHGRELQTQLQAQGIVIRRWEVYESVPTLEPSSELVLSYEAGKISAILFFSAKSAYCWLENLSKKLNVQSLRQETRYIALSEAIARTIRAFGDNLTIEIASQPTRQALMEKLGKPKATS